MEPLSRSVVSYWRLAGLVQGLSIVLFLLPVIIPIVLVELRVLPWAVGGGLLFVVLIGAWSFLTAKLRYDRSAYSVDEARLAFRSGVLVHHEIVIPVSRMQHLDIERGPVERLFGLSRLSVFTAGGRSATVRIPGLAPDRAEDIRAFILEAQAVSPDE